MQNDRFVNGFSQDDAQAARDWPITEVWQRLGFPDPVGGKVCNPFRNDTKPDCQLGGGKNIFYDYAASEQLDGIKLVRKTMGCDFKTAVEFILKRSPGAATDATPIERPAKPEKPKPESRKQWTDASMASRITSALERAKDNEQAREFLKADYGIDASAIPEEWWLFDHPKHGRGIVYKGYDLAGEPVYKYKSLARDGRGKRPCAFLHGGAGHMPLGEPSPLGLVIVSGEEKAVPPAALGYEVFCPLTGEKGVTSEQCSLLLSGERPAKIFLMNDNDDTGRKANDKSAAALVAAGYPGENIFIVQWGDGTPEHYDVNDAAKAGGIEAVQKLMTNAKPYKATIPALNVWDIDQLFDYNPPANDNILGDRILAAGEACLWVGPPDIGKTRAANQLVFDILLGRDWMGFIPIHRHDLNILMIQTENSPRRLQMDMGAQLNGCTPEQRQIVNERLHFLVPMTPEDRMLSLDDPLNIERIRKTVELYNPDLVVIDPYGDLFAGENENDAMQTRKTVKALMNVAQSANPNTAVLIIHHARSGKGAAAGADGWDRGAYARGSKALLSIVRSQINLAPGDKDGESVVIACGKNNNGPKFPAFAVRLNPELMTYAVDHDFDLEAWGQEVAGGKGGAPQKVTPAMFEVMLRDGAKRFTELRDAIEGLVGCSRSTAKRAIDRAEKDRVIIKGSGLYALPQSPVARLGSKGSKPVMTPIEPM